MAAPSAPTVTPLAKLGVGAVFEVDLVSDRAGQVLVRKRVAPGNRGSPEATTAFERELRILERMGGYHLPQLVGAGTDKAGPFILQTQAKGQPLRTLLGAANKHLDAATWMRLAVSATSALTDLHDREDARGRLGFVHGDISPDNVFWEEPDVVTFIDLSSASFRDAPIPPFPRARGSLPYVAPEIARSELAPDAAADTYALAATLLALAAGPLVKSTTEASRLIEVAMRGISGNLLEQRQDLPLEAREALALALRFERQRRLTSSRELFRRFLAVRAP